MDFVIERSGDELRIRPAARHGGQCARDAVAFFSRLHVGGEVRTIRRRVTGYDT
jgi:hypothetical protein